MKASYYLWPGFCIDNVFVMFSYFVLVHGVRDKMIFREESISLCLLRHLICILCLLFVLIPLPRDFNV